MLVPSKLLWFEQVKQGFPDRNHLINSSKYCTIIHLKRYFNERLYIEVLPNLLFFIFLSSFRRIRSMALIGVISAGISCGVWKHKAYVVKVANIFLFIVAYQHWVSFIGQICIESAKYSNDFIFTCSWSWFGWRNTIGMM